MAGKRLKKIVRVVSAGGKRFESLPIDHPEVQRKIARAEMLTDDVEGMLFLATVRKRDGSVLNRETPNRLEYLQWIGVHLQPGDDLTVTVEAKGAAADKMLLALRFGAEVMGARKGRGEC